MENKIQTNISLLDGLFLIFQALERVQKNIIQNFFRRVGFMNVIQRQAIQEMK